MTGDLSAAHKAQDKALDTAYGYRGGKDDAARAAFLFELYQQFVAVLGPPRCAAGVRRPTHEQWRAGKVTLPIDQYGVPLRSLSGRKCRGPLDDAEVAACLCAALAKNPTRWLDADNIWPVSRRVQ